MLQQRLKALCNQPYKVHSRRPWNKHGVQCTDRGSMDTSMRCMYTCMERQCYIGMKMQCTTTCMHTDRTSLGYIRVCPQLWTQCAGCQSSAGRGGILTAGEREGLKWIQVNRDIRSATNTWCLLLSLCQKRINNGLLYALVHTIDIYHTMCGLMRSVYTVFIFTNF